LQPPSENRIAVQLLPGHYTGQKGSHVKFVRRLEETVDTAIVPRKSEVPVGTIRSILSQAHIVPDDWDKLG
jgi:predicted RNA binding protein YcfA (HicA-like mRNA interferase family)